MKRNDFFTLNVISCYDLDLSLTLNVCGRSGGTLAPESQKKRLVQLCETRWVERHDAVITFAPLHPSILAGVEMCESLDANTGALLQ